MWSILKGDGLAPVRFTRPARTLVRCVRIVEPQYRELWHPMVRTAPPIILTSFTLFTRMTRRMAGCGGISRWEEVAAACESTASPRSPSSVQTYGLVLLNIADWRVFPLVRTTLPPLVLASHAE